MLKLTLLVLVALPSIFAIIPEFNQQWLEGVLKNYYAKRGEQIVKFDSTVFSPAPYPATDFSRNTTRAVVRMTFADGKAFEKSFLVVNKPSYDSNEMKIVDQLFETDVRVYQEVLPKMGDALIAYSDAASLFIEPVHVEEYGRLVFEDPEAMQYHFQDGFNGLSMEQIKMAVTQLAKFHALSAALKSKNLYSFEHFDLSHSQSNQLAYDWQLPMFQYFAKYIKSSWGQEWQNAATAFENKAKSVHQDLDNIMKRVDSKFNALQIGAYYINNIYFRQDQAQKIPAALKVSHFQNAFWNSPAIDLQFFLNTSPNEQIMTNDQMRDEIITHYAQQLVSYLKKYGYEKPVTVEEIRNEIQRTELLGFVYALNYLKGLYTQPQEVPVSEYIVLSTTLGVPQTNPFEAHGKIPPKFTSVIQKLVQRAKKVGIIQY